MKKILLTSTTLLLSIFRSTSVWAAQDCPQEDGGSIRAEECIYETYGDEKKLSKVVREDGAYLDYTYEMDNSGKYYLKTRTEYMNDYNNTPPTLKLYSIDTYLPGTKGPLLLSTHTKRWDGMYISTNLFDADDNVTATIHYNPYVGTWLLPPNSMCMTTSDCSYMGSSLCRDACLPTYDSEGNLTKLIHYNTKGLPLTVSSTEEYIYSGNTVTAKKYTDATGKITEYECTNKDNCTFKGTYKYTYDSDGDLLSKISYDEDGNIISTENYALKIYTVEQAYAATSKGNHNSISIRFK